jgi:hypothetical protein
LLHFYRQDEKPSIKIPDFDELLLDDRRLERRAVVLEKTPVLGRGRYGEVRKGFFCRNGRQYHTAVSSLNGERN